MKTALQMFNGLLLLLTNIIGVGYVLYAACDGLSPL